MRASMHPVLFQFGSITIYTYGVLVATGVVLGLWYARRQAPRAGLDPEKIWNMGIYAVLMALLLAKVWLVVTSWGYYVAHPRDILSIATFQSGGTFYGGVLGATLTLVSYSLVQKMPLVSVLDTFAAALPLGHAVGRLGCFVAGCCYGKPTALPWGVRFTNPQAAEIAGTPLHIPLHPTQIYEAAAELVNFAILVWMGRRQRFRGQLLGTYFLLYGFERGGIEFFRGDPGRTMLLNDSLSLMQVVSVGLIFAGALMWYRGLRHTATPIQPVAAPLDR
jgi:phosphatidylglycerol---prolipoprotein diacylglyceryl transferase